MSFVIDSSIALAWIYDDERTEAIEGVLELVHGMGAWVPAIWHLEVANALQQGIKQRRIDKRGRTQALANLAEMNIAVDPQTNDFAWSDTLTVADRFGLTSYDASYLELARRKAFPLATLDRQLRAAGGKLGVILL
jgi:predicted nucleic acid-binding protein